MKKNNSRHHFGLAVGLPGKLWYSYVQFNIWPLLLVGMFAYFALENFLGRFWDWFDYDGVL